MACAQLLSLACLALLASCALAAPACVDNAVVQSATLRGDTPKGCLNDKIGTVGVDSSCFSSVTIARQAGGAGCNGFNVSLLDGTNQTCFEGPVGNGTLSPAKGGGYTAKGEFPGIQQQFTGTQSADNKTFTVSVTEFDCVLTYALKAANATAANATAANATAAALPGTTARETPSTAASAPAPPTKSGVAAALPSAALVVLGAVMAIAF